MRVSKESRILTDKIYSIIKNRLIHQFRKSKWEGVIESDINKLVVSCLEKFEDNIVYEVRKSLKENHFNETQSIKKSYIGFIKMPESTLKNRIKFLFTGKL